MNAFDPDLHVDTTTDFATGTGMTETHALIIDGKPNPRSCGGKPYRTISGQEILALISNPQCCPKHDAQWFIPSAYHDHDARDFKVQTERGSYRALVLDIDKGNHDLDYVRDAVHEVTAGARVMIYATKSSMIDDKRWRIILPLATALRGADYGDTVAALADLLREAPRPVITDRSSGRRGQISFLPNRGDHYEFHIATRAQTRLSLDDACPVFLRREATRDAEQRANAEARAAAEQRQRERASKSASFGEFDQPSIVDLFNERHDIETLLVRYGYSRDGNSAHWQSRYQSSGSFATRVYPEGYWVSLSASDDGAEIGKATPSGNRTGDAFDLFVHYEHRADFTAAVRAYAAEIRPARSESFRQKDSRPRGDDGPPSGPPGGSDVEISPYGDQLELTEDGVARAFTQRFGGRVRFDHDIGAWFEWTGDHWCRDGTGLAFDWCREVARDLSSGKGNREIATARRRSFATGVEAFARSDRAHAVRQDAWDADPFLMGVPGGVVSLRNGDLRKGDAADGITKRAAVAPASSANCPIWAAFILEAAGGDPEVVDFLKRWCGYCLTGDTREHALIFLYGPGGNGKSVFLNTVARIMGDYATTAAMDAFTSSRNDKHPTDLAMLRGARMVSASETEEGRAWAEARIKQMTGGDPITARFMRQDSFTYTPQFKLTIVGNHAPALSNVDDAAKRRFNIVPFVHRPTCPDRELEAKLIAEWPAILRWMIDGTVEWLTDGLQQPESIRAATADYFGEQDMVRHWLDECCTLSPANPGHYETSAELFKSWSDFAKAAGEAVGTAKSLAPRLRRHGLRDVSRWAQGRTVRAWVGVEILKPKGASDND